MNVCVRFFYSCYFSSRSKNFCETFHTCLILSGIEPINFWSKSDRGEGVMAQNVLFLWGAKTHFGDGRLRPTTWNEMRILSDGGGGIWVSTSDNSKVFFIERGGWKLVICLNQVSKYLANLWVEMKNYRPHRGPSFVDFGETVKTRNLRVRY